MAQDIAGGKIFNPMVSLRHHSMPPATPRHRVFTPAKVEASTGATYHGRAQFFLLLDSNDDQPVESVNTGLTLILLLHRLKTGDRKPKPLIDNRIIDHDSTF